MEYKLTDFELELIEKYLKMFRDTLDIKDAESYMTTVNIDYLIKVIQATHGYHCWKQLDKADIEYLVSQVEYKSNLYYWLLGILEAFPKNKNTIKFDCTFFKK